VQSPFRENYGNQCPYVELPKDKRDEGMWLFAFDQCRTIVPTTMLRVRLPDPHGWRVVQLFVSARLQAGVTWPDPIATRTLRPVVAAVAVLLLSSASFSRARTLAR
jgi:hypothetical protein